MNAILKENATLHERIGGKMESSKLGFFSWQWVLKNGIKGLQNIEKDIRAWEERMKQHDNKESVRTLGM